MPIQIRVPRDLFNHPIAEGTSMNLAELFAAYERAIQSFAEDQHIHLGGAHALPERIGVGVGADARGDGNAAMFAPVGGVAPMLQTRQIMFSRLLSATAAIAKNRIPEVQDGLEYCEITISNLDDRSAVTSIEGNDELIGSLVAFDALAHHPHQLGAKGRVILAQEALAVVGQVLCLIGARVVAPVARDVEEDRHEAVPAEEPRHVRDVEEGHDIREEAMAWIDTCETAIANLKEHWEDEKAKYFPSRTKKQYCFNAVANLAKVLLTVGLPVGIGCAVGVPMSEFSYETLSHVKGFPVLTTALDSINETHGAIRDRLIALGSISGVLAGALAAIALVLCMQKCSRGSQSKIRIREIEDYADGLLAKSFVSLLIEDRSVAEFVLKLMYGTPVTKTVALPERAETARHARIEANPRLAASFGIINNPALADRILGLISATEEISIMDPSTFRRVGITGSRFEHDRITVEALNVRGNEREWARRQIIRDERRLTIRVKAMLSEHSTSTPTQIGEDFCALSGSDHGPEDAVIRTKLNSRERAKLLTCVGDYFSAHREMPKLSDVYYRIAQLVVEADIAALPASQRDGNLGSPAVRQSLVASLAQTAVINIPAGAVLKPELSDDNYPPHLLVLARNLAREPAMFLPALTEVVQKLGKACSAARLESARLRLFRLVYDYAYTRDRDGAERMPALGIVRNHFSNHILPCNDRVLTHQVLLFVMQRHLGNEVAASVIRRFVSALNINQRIRFLVFLQENNMATENGDHNAVTVTPLYNAIISGVRDVEVGEGVHGYSQSTSYVLASLLVSRDVAYGASLPADFVALTSVLTSRDVNAVNVRNFRDAVFGVNSLLRRNAGAQLTLFRLVDNFINGNYLQQNVMGVAISNDLLQQNLRLGINAFTSYFIQGIVPIDNADPLRQCSEILIARLRTLFELIRDKNLLVAAANQISEAFTMNAAVLRNADVLRGVRNNLFHLVNDAVFAAHAPDGETEASARMRVSAQVRTVTQYFINQVVSRGDNALIYDGLTYLNAQHAVHARPAELEPLVLDPTDVMLQLFDGCRTEEAAKARFTALMRAIALKHKIEPKQSSWCSSWFRSAPAGGSARVSSADDVDLEAGRAEEMPVPVREDDRAGLLAAGAHDAGYGAVGEAAVAGVGDIEEGGAAAALVEFMHTRLGYSGRPDEPHDDADIVLSRRISAAYVARIVAIKGRDAGNSDSDYVDPVTICLESLGFMAQERLQVRGRLRAFADEVRLIIGVPQESQRAVPAQRAAV